MIAILEINNELYDSEGFCFRSFRSEPADALTFTSEKPLKIGTPVSLKARDEETDGMQTLFKGKLETPGYAVNASPLFAPLPIRNWRNISAHALIRDLCTLANLGKPVLGFEDRNLPFFQGRRNAALSFQSLLEQLKYHGELEDLRFYVDPAGVFYLGRFQNWKKQVEVLQEDDNLIAWRSFERLSAGERQTQLIATILPQTGLFHSQAIQLYTTEHKGMFFRVEGVQIEFKDGELRQRLWLGFDQLSNRNSPP